MCGHRKIDGHIFCSGIEMFNVSYRTRQDLQRLIRAVTYLIREAPYRLDYSTNVTGGSTSLDICPLGGLLDMYHAQKATKRHDKVYALLNMSSDHLRSAALSPNYSISWEELFQRLLRHLIAGSISVQTCEHREVAIFKSKGRIFGKIISVQKDPIRGDRLRVEVALQKTLLQITGIEDWSNHWSIQMSAKPIQDGDFICILEGASKPAIIRLHTDYFTIVVLEVVFSDGSLRRSKAFERKASLLSSMHCSGELLLIWNWENSLVYTIDPQDYERWIKTNDWELEQIKPGPEGCLARARRIWNVVLVLEDIVPGWADSTEFEEMEERVRTVMIDCEKALRAEHSPAPESEANHTPLSRNTQDIYGAVVDLLFTGTYTNVVWNSGVSKVELLLFWAAKGDHRAVVELLLRTGKIDLNILKISVFPKWPLYIAVYEGHKTIVELFLRLGKLNIHTKNLAASVLLSLAAERGHKDVFRMLLGAWPEIFTSDSYLGPEPFWMAVSKGFEDTVRQLLETSKVGVNAKGVHGQTPLLKAAAGGHAAVVKLLLSTGKVDVNLKDDNERTSLWLAASEGHAAVVKLLLETGRVDVNSTNRYGETPLSRAVLGEHEAVVRLLLETHQIDFEAKDDFSLQTPLSLAVDRGYEAIVQLLLEEGQFDISLEDGFSSLSPLSRAANGGHTALVELLLEAEIVAIRGLNLPPQHPPALLVSANSSRMLRRRSC
jgi:ankyrin repeat protein